MNSKSMNSWVSWIHILLNSEVLEFIHAFIYEFIKIIEFIYEFKKIYEFIYEFIGHQLFLTIWIRGFELAYELGEFSWISIRIHLVKNSWGPLNSYMNSYMNFYVTWYSYLNSKLALEINIWIQVLMNSENMNSWCHEFMIGFHEFITLIPD